MQKASFLTMGSNRSQQNAHEYKNMNIKSCKNILVYSFFQYKQIYFQDSSLCSYFLLKNFKYPIRKCVYLKFKSHFVSLVLNEPCYEKTGFLHMRKTKTQISFAVNVKLISAFVFATQIVQSLYSLNPKFQASRYLLWLHSPVYVGPGWKPRRPVFSQGGSNRILLSLVCLSLTC